MEEYVGFLRLRRSLKEGALKVITAAVTNLRTFNFSYYLNKNAPLPHNWPVRKNELLKMAEDPAKRASVYRELFEDSNSTNEQVGNFLTELVV
jgi:hypothetical protein